MAVGVAGSSATTDDLPPASNFAAGVAGGTGDRDAVVSRELGGERGGAEAKDLSQLEELLSDKATAQAIKKADKRLWTTSELNLWTRPDDKAKKVGEIKAGKKVLVTGRKLKDRVEIVVEGDARWVTQGYLSADKPVGVGAGLSMDPCPDPSVENGLTDKAVYVYRSVCNAFPQVTSYGGWDAHGEHSSGRAIDIMTSDVTLGTAIAEFLRAHASELGLYDVIWRQHIWTPERAGEGWRAMENRGSATANHYDHVHVSVY
ncbi:mucin-2 protein [Nocardioides humilatus]|uniref:mucin-2 protein n=1 Tax=Nocardioides humilatus TaxID=2607660 RepID=UPI001FE7AEBA|nr:mucin-2 protein [Nocardioides humilatus]